MIEFGGFCRREGLKFASQCLRIYREIARSGKHPDAQAIYLWVRKRIPTISLDTIYRTLLLLEGKNVISKTGIVSGKE